MPGCDHDSISARHHHPQPHVPLPTASDCAARHPQLCVHPLPGDHTTIPEGVSDEIQKYFFEMIVLAVNIMVVIMAAFDSSDDEAIAARDRIGYGYVILNIIVYSVIILLVSGQLALALVRKVRSCLKSSQNSKINPLQVQAVQEVPSIQPRSDKNNTSQPERAHNALFANEDSHTTTTNLHI